MTTATISPWPLVRQGDPQHPVQTLQYLLRARGHNPTVDGIVGPVTWQGADQPNALVLIGEPGPAGQRNSRLPAACVCQGTAGTGAGRKAMRLSSAEVGPVQYRAIR